MVSKTRAAQDSKLLRKWGWKPHMNCLIGLIRTILAGRPWGRIGEQLPDLGEVVESSPTFPESRQSTGSLAHTALIVRLPARESRCRVWSPEEASSGAVPLQEAKWPLVGNRETSPMSPSSRAAPDGPIPLSDSSPLPVSATRAVSCFFAACGQP